MTSRGLRGLGPPTPPPLLWVWMWVVVVVVVAVAPPARGSDQLIVWGRCYSFCLHTHLQQPHSGEVDTLPAHPIRVCHRHPACRWCLYVCERPRDQFTNSTSCLRDCRHTRTRPGSRGRESCAEACRFVSGAGRARGGRCPVPDSLRGFQAACVDSCSQDAACSRAADKCCSNQCGRVCVEPTDVHILPPVPANLRFKLLKTGGVLISWQPGGPDSRVDPPGAEGQPQNSSGESGGVRRVEEPSPPVVFIFRWWCPYTSGAVTSVTDRARTRVQGYPAGIYPGSKCHFMVSAVNLHGSRGFSKVSPYIKQFLLPSPPLHLDQVRSRVHGGKVDVTIQWQPPVYTDGLPVFRYQVFWSDSLPRASPSYMRLHMHKRVLSADRHSFVLESLSMGTIYFVQVRAVVRWKRRQKVGKPASTYIETFAPPQPANEEDGGETGGGGRGRGGSVIDSVTVNQTFYDQTVLKTHITWTLKPGKSARKYLIYWKADTCARNEHRKTHPRLETSATSHAQSFSLYNLRPQCEYSVRVHAVRSRGRTGAATVTSFLTPSCHLIPVRRGDPPQCRTPDPPEEVQGLHAETSQCVTVVRWMPPSSPAPRLRAYDVMWGRTEGGGGFSASTVIYTSTPLRLSVPANSTSATVGRLRAGDHYTVQVRGVSEGGTPGPPSILPLLVPHPDLPCPPSPHSPPSPPSIPSTPSPPSIPSTPSPHSDSASSSVADDSDTPDAPPAPHSNSSLTSPPTADDVTTSSDDTAREDDDSSTSSSSGNRTRSYLSTSTDVTIRSDVTDDEDEVYFSGDDEGWGDRVAESEKDTDFYLNPSSRNVTGQSPPTGSDGNGSHATSNQDLNLSPQQTGGELGPRGPTDTAGRGTAQQDSPTTSPGERMEGRGGAGRGRTCWWCVVTAVLLSVTVRPLSAVSVLLPPPAQQLS